MNKMEITEVIVNKNVIKIEYIVSGEWKKLFNTDKEFIIEYSKEIENVNKSIAVIPFMTNILPMVWVFDAELFVDELDKEFYDSISGFKNGYIDMYKNINFQGKVYVESIIKNRQERNNNTVTLFSGGVDAYHTLITHVEERPTLISMWGADIKTDNEKGWSVVEKHIKQVAQEYNLEYVIIKSTFREFINEYELSTYTKKMCNDNWWHGFQHGIGLLGHVASYAWQYNINKLYIASSFTIEDKGKVTCASDPTIDNYLKFANCQVIHDGYDCNRQAKINRICNYVKEKGSEVQLRVCWESEKGSNCCNCEKCYRTILGIIAEKQDPRKYGFNYSDEQFIVMMKDMKNRIFVRNNFRYTYIQNAFRENYSRNDIGKDLRWFYVLDINSKRPSVHELFFRGKRKIKRILMKS